jgi:fructose-1,6-bisphosphatase/sedoheptulose 1,7-bisphosphatase-like protein
MSRFDQLERVMERDRKSALVATVRQMGFNAALSDAQILALVPDVDPREPGGVAKVEEFRQQNPSLFRSSGPTPESVIEAARVDVSQVQAKAGKLFNADALVRSLFGGGR